MKNSRAVMSALALVATVLGTVVFLSTRQPSAALPRTAHAVAPSRPMVQIFSGHIEAQTTVAVEVPKTAPVNELLVDVGQNVVEGQVLARLVTSAPADGAASAFLAAEARTAAAKSAAAEAKLEAAKAKADAQRAKEQATQKRLLFEREKKLMEVGATPRQTLERTQRECEAAEAESFKVEEVWRGADNHAYAMADQMREADAAFEAARKQDERARAFVAAAEIHAPATGIVVWRKSTEDTGELFRIAVNVDRLRAVFAAEKIKIGDDVLITVPALPVPPIHASVSVVTGAQAIADFTSLHAAIRPGAPCTVSVQLK